MILSFIRSLLRDILLRCYIQPTFFRSPDAVPFLSYLFELHEPYVKDINETIRNQIPNQRRSILKKYATIYFKVTMCAVVFFERRRRIYFSGMLIRHGLEARVCFVKVLKNCAFSDISRPLYMPAASLYLHLCDKYCRFSLKTSVTRGLMRCCIGSAVQSYGVV